MKEKAIKEQMIDDLAHTIHRTSSPIISLVESKKRAKKILESYGKLDLEQLTSLFEKYKLSFSLRYSYDMEQRKAHVMGLDFAEKEIKEEIESGFFESQSWDEIDSDKINSILELNTARGILKKNPGLLNLRDKPKYNAIKAGIRDGISYYKEQYINSKNKNGESEETRKIQ